MTETFVRAPAGADPGPAKAGPIEAGDHPAAAVVKRIECGTFSWLEACRLGSS